MSSFYKPNRNPLWNYGGPNWRLSRSKIDLFVECPRCFYVDNKLGVARPPGFPFNLNSAVDHLLKKEFDIHRAGKTRHPLMESYGVDAIPFAHDELDIWRENFKGIQYAHKPTGFTISGAIDDVWINKDKELIVVDYKSTSKDEEITALDQDWHAGYKRQMEVYQWLLRRKGFVVSPVGYFVYANASKDKKAFDGKLEFAVTLIANTGDDTWIEPKLHEIKDILDGGLIPDATTGCDYCRYRESAGKALRAVVMEKKESVVATPKPLSSPKKKTTSGPKTQEQLF